MIKPLILVPTLLLFFAQVSAQPPCTIKNDFTFTRNICTPLSVSFLTTSTGYNSIAWDFGNSQTINNNPNPTTIYTNTGNYIVRMIQNYGSCIDTVIKQITVDFLPDNQLIQTNDTTICAGSSKQLKSGSSLNTCWSPSTFLNNPNSPNPVASPNQSITYYLNAETIGNNLIVNGNFSLGNTGFTSAYNYVSTNTTEAEYFVGTNPQAWNSSTSPCPDHTTGNGNMLLVNGAPTPNVKVWGQTIAVVPNTNYAFSTWIQSIYPVNPAKLQFSINGNNIGSLITASVPPCNWTQFYTTWNSGNNSSAIISIVNQNTFVQGNDFALDDISFAPVFIKRDSVRITVEIPQVVTNNSLSLCTGNSIQLSTTGASTYSWTPAAGLNDAAIGNPIASPTASTQFIVTGTTANGCTGKDTVTITVNPKPAISKSSDATICSGNSIQLNASGGTGYAWSPASSLNNANIPNPIASPVTTTKYYVTVSDINNCSNIDSVFVTVKASPVFTINPPLSVCPKDSIQLTASGGELYSWQPAGSLSNASIPNPKASPSVTTNYTVIITDTVCQNTSTLSTSVSIRSLPAIKANKLNDIDCTNDQSQLMASGGLSYTWTPAATLNNPNTSSPIAKPFVSTSYIVRGTDAAGCSNVDSVTVNVTTIGKSKYLMPSGFTPNNDGRNDFFGIKGWGSITELEFSIFNRWGERIFYTKNPSDCWNGKIKGLEQNPGIFIYVIRARTICENDIFKKGTFVLIR